jgi:small-conductance mechanosensitive channel
MFLAQWLTFAGEQQNLRLLHVTLIGVNKHNGERLLFTLALLVIVFLLSRLIKGLVHLVLHRWSQKRIYFWTRQAVNVLLAIILVGGLVSIWFEDSSHLATFAGLLTAGVAFALQQVITALAGYVVILRGKTFTVGDRIVMGGVRGDVSALGFTQTRIMEMGQPPATQDAPPAMWVKARQYTGRIVTISNAKIFDEPVYNYTREFPYIWDEISLPVGYKADRKAAEKILLDAAAKHTLKTSDLDHGAIEEMKRRYQMDVGEMVPRVYWRLTDNWLELTVRFLCDEHGVRDLKDRMSRDILPKLDEAGIEIASSTYDVVGMPPLRIVHEEQHAQHA